MIDISSGIANAAQRREAVNKNNYKCLMFRAALQIPLSGICQGF